MLSISPAEFDTLQGQYADTNLSPSMVDYDVIGLAANELSAVNQQAATEAVSLASQSSNTAIWTKPLFGNEPAAPIANGQSNSTPLEWASVYSVGTVSIMEIDGVFDFTGTLKEGETRFTTGFGFFDDFFNSNTRCADLIENLGNFSWGTSVRLVLENFGVVDRTLDMITGGGTVTGTGVMRSMDHGQMTNNPHVLIERAQVAGYGFFDNNITPYQGILTNRGIINYAIVDAYGTLNNGTAEDSVMEHTPSIGTVFVCGDGDGRGTLNNSAGAEIGLAIIDRGGYLTNINSTIKLVTVNGGTLGNANSGTDTSIETIFLNGGTVDNRGRIDNLTYIGGYYECNTYNVPGAVSGSISTLTVANDSTGINWGTVDDLKFDCNGSGSITVRADNRINAKNVDLTNGNIVLDLTGHSVGNDLGVYVLSNYGDGKGSVSMTSLLAACFTGNTTTFKGINFLNSFAVTHGDQVLEILADGTLTNTWSVKTKDKSVVTTCEDSLTANDGKISLREAIRDTPSGGIITFAPIVSGNTVTLNGTQLSIDKNITIDSAGNNITIAANSATNKASRVFDIAPSATVTLAGLTITGGNVNENGGGIYNRGTLSIIDCTIIGNTGAWGGGIYNTGTLTVKDSTFMGNVATVSGGAIWGGATITNSTISGNSADKGGGGIETGGTLIITNSAISRNKAEYGGGIHNNGHMVTVTNCEIVGNRTKKTGDNYGGGIDNRSGTLTITDSLLAENTASWGGGIYNYGTTTVTNSMISDNIALYYGGGIVNGGPYSTGSGTLTVTSCIISRNRASATVANDPANGHQGGGIYNSGTATVTNSLIAKNEAAEIYGGDGIFSRYMLTVTNCTIANNYGVGIGSSGGVVGSTRINLYNTIVVENDDYDIYQGYADLIINGSKNLCGKSYYSDSYSGSWYFRSVQPGNYNSDPLSLFKDYANDDYRLASGSQATNQGNNDYAKDAELQYDLSGKKREINGIVDIGAYENGAYPETPINLRSTDKTHYSLTLAWDTTGDTKSNASGYTIQYRKVGGTLLDWKVTGGETTQTTIPNLAADTQYEIQICALNSGGNSDWSKSIYITTETAPFLSSFITVTTLDDVVNSSGTGMSLREAIANVRPGGTVTFDADLVGTITLSDSELLIDKSIIIDTKGTDITINANKRSRIFNIASGITVELIGLTLTGGQASSGGAIYNDGTLMVIDCTISGNRAMSNGGAIFCADTSILKLDRTKIISNTATEHGGGIYQNRGTFEAYNTLFAENTARQGAAVYTKGTLPGYDSMTTKIVSSTIANNSSIASGNNGAIYTDISNLSLILPVKANREIYNTIFTGNSNNKDVYWDGITNASGSTTVIGNTIRTSGGTFGFENIGVTVTYVGFNDVVTVSQLALDSNYRPTAGSAAIDKVNKPDEYLPAIYRSKDLAGNSRVFNGSMDVGAYEFVTTKLSTPTLGDVIATSSSTISVAWNAVTNANGYTIQYATSSSFLVGISTVTVNSGSTTSANITGLKENTTYYVRVRADGTGNFSNSDRSAAKSVTTDKIKLGTPMLADVAATGSSTISVAWNVVTNASGYVVQYATDAAFTTVIDAETTNSLSTIISGLDPNTTYFIRVTATGTGNYSNSDPSAAKSATTDKNVIPTPTLDFDGDGKVNDRDANLLMFYAMNLPSASSLWTSYLDQNSTRTPIQIIVYINENKNLFDLDGDGKVNDRDTNLLMFYAMNLPSGSSLWKSYLDQNSTRTPAQIIDYINTLLPSSSIASATIAMNTTMAMASVPVSLSLSDSLTNFSEVALPMDTIAQIDLLDGQNKVESKEQMSPSYGTSDNLSSVFVDYENWIDEEMDDLSQWNDLVTVMLPMDALDLVLFG